MDKETKRAYYLFSPWLRMFHWIMVCCVLTLFATGLYIGSPGFGGFPGEDPTVQVGNLFSMETIRRVHFYAGFVLICAFMFRIYGAILNKGDRLLPRPTERMYWTGMIATIKHYLFIPQKHEGEYLRNSLARTAYLGVYFLLAIEAVTGLAMFSMITPNSFLSKLFRPVYDAIGPFQTHMLHHYIAWLIIIFAMSHVYLAFREDLTTRNGEVSSMISGRKYYAEDPDDIGDIR